jgi:Protein of unknown function (DUF1646)
MLIRGNVSNIVAAGALGITSREWCSAFGRIAPDGRLLRSVAVESVDLHRSNRNPLRPKLLTA